MTLKPDQDETDTLLHNYDQLKGFAKTKMKARKTQACQASPGDVI